MGSRLNPCQAAGMLSVEGCNIEMVNWGRLKYYYTQMHIFGGPDHCFALIMSTNAGFKLAPPTKNPSMSDCVERSLQFFSLTLPP